MSKQIFIQMTLKINIIKRQLPRELRKLIDPGRNYKQQVIPITLFYSIQERSTKDLVLTHLLR